MILDQTLPCLLLGALALGFIDASAHPIGALRRTLPEPLRARMRDSWLRRSLIAAWRRVRGLGSEEDERYFAYVERTSRASASAIADAIIRTYAPANVFDVGCGTGVLLDDLRSKGVRVSGVEYSPVALRYCRERGLDVKRCDLCDRLVGPDELVDLAICVEVAHQLPLECGLRLASDLCRIARVVVFSANTPGSGDRIRLNEQPHDWWIDRFAAQGFRFNEPLTLQWRAEWRVAGAAPWFCKNTLVFEREPQASEKS